MPYHIFEYIFNLSIVIGLIIPLFNILSGWLGGVFGGDINMDTDVGADSGSSGSIPIPFDIMCLCLGLVVFGAMGRALFGFMTSLMTVILVFLGSALLAAAAYISLYKLLVRRMRENKSSAISYHDLSGKNATVTLGISKGSVGTISLLDSTGAAITFRAKMDSHLEPYMPEVIPRGEPVVITEVSEDEKLCYVSVYHNRLEKQTKEE